MANPAVKNGHIDIANELADVLVKTHLTGNEHQVLWSIWRKTWGWKDKNKKKDFDWISLTQLENLTSLNRVAVCRAKKLLVSKMILLEKNGKIGFNQNYDQWVVSKMTLVSKTAMGSVKNGNEGSVENDTYNRYITKDTNTKEMKNKKYFLNERRKDLGLPPIKSNPNDFITRSRLIDVFKKAVNEIHNKSYFTDPDDIADLKKENSRINGQIKIFWLRCKKDLKKATEIINWYAEDYGKWKNWTPGYCFRKDTVIDFENKGSEKGGKEVFEL